MQLPIRAVFQPIDQRTFRVPCVNMDIQSPSRPQNAQHLGSRLFRLGAVVEHPVRIDVIEGSIGKWKPPHVSLDDRGAIADPTAGQLQVHIGDIHSRSRCAMLRKLKQIAAASAPHLEDPFARMPPKFPSFIEPWIDGIALLFGQEQRRFIPMLRCELGGIGQPVVP